MKTRLVIYREGEDDQFFPLNQPRVTIGREADNMIQLSHEKISKHHAILHQVKGTWTIEDLQSRNGVLVNGQKAAKAELKNGDRIKIGPYELSFEADVPSDNYVPSVNIDMSSRIAHQTITEKGSPGKT